VRDAGNLTFLAQNEIASPAGFAHKTMPAMPAHPDALSLFPNLHSVTEFLYRTDDFMTRDARIFNTGVSAFLDKHVAVADAAGFNLYQQFTGAGIRYIFFHDLEVGSSPGDLNGLHLCHITSFIWSDVVARGTVLMLVYINK
jgi:hypothetical protein